MQKNLKSQLLLLTCLKALFFFPSSPLSAETAPWTGIDKLLFVTPWGCYSHFGPLPIPSAHDVWFQGVELDIALDRDLEADFSLEVVETSRRTFLYNSFEANFSKVYFNDLIGDPFSLMLTVGVKNVGGRALAEPALLHFGEWEWRAMLAVGKEWTRCLDWWLRLSGFTTVGVANRGAPWLEAGVLLEQKLSLCRRYGIGLEASQGFGGKNISTATFFKGWGPFYFTLLSLFASYTEIICDIEWTLSFERSLWTHDTFGNSTSLSLEMTFPLSP